MNRKPKVWRRPDPTLANGKLREFRPRISCRHEWEPNVCTDLDASMVVVAIITPGERCMLCAATCLRDPQGRIVEYESFAGYAEVEQYEQGAA